MYVYHVYYSPVRRGSVRITDLSSRQLLRESAALSLATLFSYYYTTVATERGRHIVWLNFDAHKTRITRVFSRVKVGQS
jgi:hypothetical protein